MSTFGTNTFGSGNLGDPGGGEPPPPSQPAPLATGRILVSAKQASEKFKRVVRGSLS